MSALRIAALLERGDDNLLDDMNEANVSYVDIHK